MRLRIYFSYKLLIILFSSLILIFVFINNFNKTHKEAHTQLNNDYLITINLTSKEVVGNSLQQLPSLSINKLLNFNNFHYLLQPNICSTNNTKELLALLLITSYAGHDNLRSAHRQAITQAKLAEMGMQRIFLLAGIPTREHFITQSQVINEHQRFGDLLQGDFEEAYRNLSYKHVMGLQWSATNCYKAKFLIKIDDDIVYDVFHFKRYLESLEVSEPIIIKSNNYLAGYILENRPVIRNSANKWFVTIEEYPANVYPAYLSGWLYLTNPHTAERLVRQAYQLLPNIFWIDDTWLTGIIRHQLDIPLRRLNNWYLANSEFLRCCVRDLQQRSLECEYFVAPNGGDHKLIIDFLHNIEKCYYDECIKRTSTERLNQTCVAPYKHILPDHGIGQIQPVSLGR